MSTPAHTIRFSEDIEKWLVVERVRRGIRTLDELVPIIVEEYRRMWEDLESGAALLKADDSE